MDAIDGAYADAGCVVAAWSSDDEGHGKSVDELADLSARRHPLDGKWPSVHARGAMRVQNRITPLMFLPECMSANPSLTSSSLYSDVISSLNFKWPARYWLKYLGNSLRAFT